MSKRLLRCEAPCRSPFDRLRATGGGLESSDDFPFVLSPSTMLRTGLSKHEHHFFSTLSAWAVPTLLLFLFLPLLACAPKPEESKALVKISNVKVWRTDEQTLKVSLDYDLEMGVRLPLPYKEVLVFPLEPKVELGGTLAPFELHVGTVGVTLQIPKDAGFDWKDLDDKDTCCIVSLKGMQEKPGTKTAHYERISNEVRVLPPQISG